MTFLDHLLNATSPQADKRKLGGDEERVQKDQKADRRQPYRDVYGARGSLRAGRPPSRIGQGGRDPRSLDAASVPQFGATGGGPCVAIVAALSIAPDVYVRSVTIGRLGRSVQPGCAGLTPANSLVQIDAGQP